MRWNGAGNKIESASDHVPFLTFEYVEINNSLCNLFLRKALSLSYSLARSMLIPSYVIAFLQHFVYS